MIYALCLGLLILLYAVLYILRERVKRRCELYRRSIAAMPVGGDGISRFVCVRCTDDSSGSYFLPSSEE